MVFNFSWVGVGWVLFVGELCGEVGRVGGGGLGGLDGV